MVRKKAKVNSTIDQRSALTNHKIEKSPALEAVSPAASPVAIAEPTVEKSTRASKKAAKTKVAESVKEAEPVEKEAEPVEKEAEPASKKTAKEQASEKPVKMKRLTLDIAKPLHKAIKAKAVEEGIPMVDMLRSLLEKYYGNR
ncbi:MAG: hypothetical protein LH702_18215 [Phormidesmis sp. CAN_BIN44]|nr:hypothetical protein [Phormidesmis sp. CAN_BIN44]